VTLFPTHSPRLQFCLPQTHSWPAGKQTKIKVETPGQLCADTRLVFSFATSAAAVQKPRNKMQLIPRTELLEPLEPWNPETLRSLLPSPHWLYQILFNCRLGSVFGVRCSVLSMQSSSQTWILQHCKRFCCIGILSTAWAPVLEILLCQRQMPLHSDSSAAAPFAGRVVCAVNRYICTWLLTNVRPVRGQQHRQQATQATWTTKHSDDVISVRL